MHYELSDHESVSKCNCPACKRIATLEAENKRLRGRVGDLEGALSVDSKVAEKAARLGKLLDDTADHWMQLVGSGTEDSIPWEGAIDSAMEAAVGEIRRLRERVGELEGELKRVWELWRMADRLRKHESDPKPD